MQWQIRLFGALEAQGDEEGGCETWRGTKAGALLAYLALKPDRPRLREDLAEFLWPDGDPATKRTRLRQEIAVLRGAFGEEGDSETGAFAVSRTDICFRSASAVTDVAEFERALERARKSPDPAAKEAALQEAVALYRTDLLTDYPDHFLAERSHYAQGFEDALQTLAGLQRQRGDAARAIETLKTLVARDPLREETHADLMRLYAHIGQPALVRRQYEELARATREGLGEEPTEATKRLLVELREQPSPAMPLPEITSQPEPPSPESEFSEFLPMANPMPSPSPTRKRISPWFLSVAALILSGIALWQPFAARSVTALMPLSTPSPLGPEKDGGASIEELFAAIDDNDVSGATKLLKERASPDGLIDGNTAFAHAAELGRTAIVKEMLKYHPNIEFRWSPNVSSFTPLFLAAAAGKAETVGVLLDAGADVNTASPQSGVTALMYACRFGHYEVVRVLLENGADKNLQDQNGNTATDNVIHVGDRQTRKKILKLLRQTR